jgi:hypothetical protein
MRYVPVAQFFGTRCSDFPKRAIFESPPGEYLGEISCDLRRALHHNRGPNVRPRSRGVIVARVDDIIVSLRRIDARVALGDVWISHLDL